MAEKSAILDIILRARDEASAELEKSKGALEGVGKAALAVGAVGALAIAGIAAEAVHLAGNFQYTTQTLVTGAGEDQKNLEMIRQGVLNLAGEVGQTPQKLAEGLYMIESAGFHADKALTVLSASARTATVAGATMESVSDALTSALNAYGYQASDSTKITDKLLETVRLGKMHMQDLADNIGKVMPIASATGVSLDQLTGAVATMTAQGTDAAQATTALRFLITNLASPTAKATKAMAEFGLKSIDVARDLKTKGLSGALQEIEDHIAKKFPPGSAEFTAALDSMVGGTRGMTAALELGGAHMATFKDNVNSVSHASDGAGRTMEGWKEHQNDFNIVMERLEGGLDAILIRIGNRLLPVVTAAAQKFVEWEPTIQAVVDRILGAGGALDILGQDLTNVGKFLQSVGTELDKHKGRYEVLAGFLAAVMLPTLIKTAVSFGVDVATGVIGATAALIGNTAAWIANVYWNNVSNALLIFYYARLVVTTAAQWLWTAAQTAWNGVAMLSMMILERGVAGTALYIAKQIAVRGATLAWQAAQWLLNIALDANPIGIIIIAIAALVAGIIYAYQHSETFRNIVNGLWAAISSGASAIWSDIKPPLDWLLGALGNLAGMAAKVVGALSGLSNVSLPDIHIPGFASGGYVQKRPGGQLAVVGEGSEDEWILRNSQLKGLLSGAAAQGGGGGGDQTIILQVDGKEMARVVSKHQGRQFKLQGGMLGSGA